LQALSLPFVLAIVRGLDPVHRLKARENAAGSENPNKYAVSISLNNAQAGFNTLTFRSCEGPNLSQSVERT
jgi:hypothetical protein